MNPLLTFIFQDEQELVKMVFEGELKITNIPWNDSLTDPESKAYMDLKSDLEDDMDESFCSKPSKTNESENSTCHTRVIGFSQGSINVFFLIIKIEVANSLPILSEVLTTMLEALNSVGLGEFIVDKTSVKIGNICT